MSGPSGLSGSTVEVLILFIGILVLATLICFSRQCRRVAFNEAVYQTALAIQAMEAMEHAERPVLAEVAITSKGGRDVDVDTRWKDIMPLSLTEKGAGASDSSRSSDAAPLRTNRGQRRTLGKHRLKDERVEPPTAAEPDDVSPRVLRISTLIAMPTPPSASPPTSCSKTRLPSPEHPDSPLSPSDRWRFELCIGTSSLSMSRSS
ncbi:hypothetical protein FISHEDRAFT_72695 [Fistulina hepatica ATCC 64428]|nr:hypothetical protein FISHEDRAFT_72695 [Fistulina hepatica ATCC 64428]